MAGKFSESFENEEKVWKNSEKLMKIKKKLGKYSEGKLNVCG